MYGGPKCGAPRTVHFGTSSATTAGRCRTAPNPAISIADMKSRGQERTDSRSSTSAIATPISATTGRIEKIRWYANADVMCLATMPAVSGLMNRPHAVTHQSTSVLSRGWRRMTR